MNAQEVRQYLDDEISSGKTFVNWHGITQDNLSECLVPPVQIEVEHPKTAEKLLLWLVLQTGEGPDHYVIAFDPKSLLWVLIYRDAQSKYNLIRRTKRFSKALDMM